MKIKNIKKIDYSGDVYNLHIEDNHNYFANNHCVSNCHDFDDVMSDFISIRITENLIKKFKFTGEYDIMKRLKKVNTIVEYVEFLRFLNDEIISTMDSMESGMSNQVRSIKSDKRCN